ncbi:hypothetical protein [Actinoplanes auranticolor]|uniref:Uncharacterized protein n=1 Tax=Actinoplanes auranticolor TaxID=47988 RepID=A0A919VRP7_9ACTN|nr:hypothetical protein [Actinoplanes auranticolor]GIM73090.1 hypothetical protein Aau02nite_54230 [Actinoplanes auranticolor]
MTTMPAAFIGHGNPMNALETNRYTRQRRSRPACPPTASTSERVAPAPMWHDPDMAESSSPLRVGASVFRWATAILVVVAWFFWMAAAVESDWIDGLADNGTGAVIATALLAVPLLLALLAAMLHRFREARLAALLSWGASLPLFGALLAFGYHLTYTPA